MYIYLHMYPIGQNLAHGHTWPRLVMREAEKYSLAEGPFSQEKQGNGLRRDQ